jgi:hypothetical protein
MAGFFIFAVIFELYLYMKIMILWIVTSLTSETAQCFGGTYRFPLQAESISSACSLHFLFPCLAYSLTLKTEVVCSLRMSGCLRTARLYNAEGPAAHSDCSENMNPV